MVLRRFTGGDAPLSRPWEWVIGAIDRLSRMAAIATVPGIGNLRIGEAIDGLGLQELAGEDFWTRE